MQMIRDKEWCYIMIKESIHQRYNNPKWVCNKQESFKTPEAKTTLDYSLTASSKVKHTPLLLSSNSISKYFLKINEHMSIKGLA